MRRRAGEPHAGEPARRDERVGGRRLPHGGTHGAAGPSDLDFAALIPFIGRRPSGLDGDTSEFDERGELPAAAACRKPPAPDENSVAGPEPRGSVLDT